MFYLVLNSLDERTALIAYLKTKNIQTVFHYLSLHKSPYYSSRYQGKELPNADRYTDYLLRLPMYGSLELEEVSGICNHIRHFFESRK